VPERFFTSLKAKTSAGLEENLDLLKNLEKLNQVAR
jgi:hypothetical protein